MATDLDLTDDTTKEEMNEFVDQVVKDVAEDRAGEPERKSDHEMIAEDHEETTAGTSLDPKHTASDGEDTGESEGQDQDWLDDDLKAEVAAYGISEEELADFTSREEVQRALRIFERSVLEAGRKAMAEGGKGETQAKETSPTRDAKGRFVKGESKEESKEDDSKESTFEIKLDKEAYDEGLVEELTRLRDHYEGRIGDMENRLEEADKQAEDDRVSAEERHFDNLVDALGHADLFGRSGQENDKQLERRQDLYVAAKAQVIGLHQLGREVDLDGTLVTRVANMVFAKELGKKELKSRTRKVSKQSDGRMGGSSTKAHDSKPPLMEEMDRLYKELENA